MPPESLSIPDELPVTLNWGPRVGTARLTADGRGVTAAIRFDGPAGRQGADAILAGHAGELSFNVREAVPWPDPPTAPQPAADGRVWQIITGHRHRHWAGAAPLLGPVPGWVEHSHLAGGTPHRHDPESGVQIPVGCDPERCRAPFGSHAPTCRS